MEGRWPGPGAGRPFPGPDHHPGRPRCQGQGLDRPKKGFRKAGDTRSWGKASAPWPMVRIWRREVITWPGCRGPRCPPGQAAGRGPGATPRCKPGPLADGSMPYPWPAATRAATAILRGRGSGDRVLIRPQGADLAPAGPHPAPITTGASMPDRILTVQRRRDSGRQVTPGAGGRRRHPGRWPGSAPAGDHLAGLPWASMPTRAGSLQGARGKRSGQAQHPG